MEKQERLDLFKTELSFISDEKIRNFVEEMLGKLPDYFFVIPASSTGKYHPDYALGDQGLVRHTKAAVRIACELFTILPQYSALDRDLCIAALILHDGCKNGKNGSVGAYTMTTHPLEVVDLIKDSYPMIAGDLMFIDAICDLISTHMGQWNKDYRTGAEVLPLPKTKQQNFVHMCDYLASRKCLEFNFNAMIEKRW